jgi:hypothetical protein
MPHDDFEGPEPVPGLPATPPEGERILWQGRPDWWALTRESLLFWWVAGYFVFLGAWRSVALMDIVPLATAIWGAVPFLLLGAVVCALLMLTAWAQARATMYTITNRRVAMRVGAALTVTLNLPFREISNAALDVRKGGTGTIVFDLMGETRLSYLVFWPHVRPWRINPTQPALRCIPFAANVAEIFAEAAQARVSEPVITPSSGVGVPAE